MKQKKKAPNTDRQRRVTLYLWLSNESYWHKREVPTDKMVISLCQLDGSVRELGSGVWGQSLLFSRDKNRQCLKPTAPGLAIKLTTALEEVKMMPCKKALIPYLPSYLASAAMLTALVSCPEPQEKVGILSLAKGTLLEVG